MRRNISSSKSQRGESVQGKRKNDDEKAKSSITKKTNTSSSLQAQKMKPAKKVENTTQRSIYNQSAYLKKAELSRTNATQHDESNTHLAKRPKTPIFSQATVTTSKKDIKSTTQKNKSKDLSVKDDILIESRLRSQSDIRSKNETPRSGTYRSNANQPRSALKNPNKLEDSNIKYEGAPNIQKKRQNGLEQKAKDQTLNNLAKSQKLNSQKEKYKEEKIKDRSISQKTKNDHINERKTKDNRLNVSEQKLKDEIKDKTTEQQRMKYKIANNPEFNNKFIEQKEIKNKSAEDSRQEIKNKTEDNLKIGDKGTEHQKIEREIKNSLETNVKATGNDDKKDQATINHETKVKPPNNQEIKDESLKNQIIEGKVTFNLEAEDEIVENYETKNQIASNQELNSKASNNLEIASNIEEHQEIEGENKNNQVDNKNSDQESKENKDKPNNKQAVKDENKTDKQSKNIDDKVLEDSHDEYKKSSYIPDFDPISVNQRPPLTKISSGAVALDFNIFQQAMNNIQQSALQLQKRLNNKLCCIQKKIADLELSVEELLK